MFRSYTDLVRGESARSLKMLDMPCIWDNKELFIYLCKEYDITYSTAMWEEFLCIYYIPVDKGLLSITILDYLIQYHIKKD